MTALAARGRHHRPSRARLAVQRRLAAIAAWRLRRRIEAEQAAAADNLWAASLHEINLETGPIRSVTAAGPPPAAVLADRDVPGLEHLGEGQYGDDTHAFSRYVDGGQE
jgi:hypothetical protein